MNDPKVQLSEVEMNLVCNAAIILTKNEVLRKVKELLERVQQQMTNHIFETGLKNDPMLSVNPKISKGENYLGLPYLVLDYPRNFSGEHIFAIRTFFWWGNFFSSTLHISGTFKPLFLLKIHQAYHPLASGGYFISSAEDAWQHHFEQNNYVLIKDLSEEDFIDICNNQTHIKIATKWPLTTWNHVPEVLMQSWKRLLNICIT